MTTNIMFLRDMNTMTKRGMNIKQGLAKAMLLVLLFLVGGMVSEAWAGTYTYVLLGAPDGSGHRPQVAITENTTENAELPLHMVSPFVSAYHYYSKATGNSDGTFTVGSEDLLTAGSAHGKSDRETIYVTYDVDNTKAPFSNMSAHYNIKLRNNASLTFARGGSSPSYGDLRYKGGEGTNDVLLADEWIFEGDPYTICLRPVSSIYDGTDMVVYTPSVSKDSYFYIKPSSEVVYDKFMLVRTQDSTTDFILRVNPGASTTATGKISFTDYNGNIVKNWYTDWDNKSNNNKIYLTKVTTATTTYFHVVDDSGNIVASASASTTDGETLTSSMVPTELERHGVDLDKTHFYKDRFKQNTVTTASADNPDIYLAYSLNSNCPVTFSTDFASATWYNMRFGFQFTNSTYLSKANASKEWVSYFMPKPGKTAYEANGRLWSYIDIDNTSSTDLCPDGDTDPRTYFAFIGNPYSFSVINLYAGVGMTASLDGSATAGTYLKMMGTDTKWTWVAPTDASQSGYTSFKVVLPSTFSESNKLMWDSWYSGARLQISEKTSSTGATVFVKPVPIQKQLIYQIYTEDGSTLLATSGITLYPKNEVVSGASLTVPDNLKRALCTYEYYDNASFTGNPITSITMDDDKVVYVKCIPTSNTFTSESDLSDESLIKWKHLKGSYTNPYLVTNDGSTLEQAASVPSDVIDVDAYTFAMVGNPYNFRLVSKKAGNYTTTDVHPAASTNNSTISVGSTDAALSHWEAVLPKNTGTFAFALKDSWTYAATPTGSFLRANNSTRQLAVGNQDNSYDFTLEDYQPRIAVTYKVFRSAGTQVEEASIVQLVGSTPVLPSSAQRIGISSYAYHRGSVTGENIGTLLSTDAIVYVTYTIGSSPFTFTPATGDALQEYENATWYNIRFANRSHEGKWLYWNGSNVKVYTTSTTDLPQSANFAFVGDPYRFRVINMALGEKWDLPNSGNRVNLVFKSGTDDDDWTLAEPYGTGGTFQIMGNEQYSATPRVYRNWDFSTSDTSGSGNIWDQYTNSNNLEVQEITKTYYPLSYTVVDKDMNVVATKSTYYEAGDAIAVELPEVLKRGYCDYDGLYATKGATELSDKVETLPTTMPSSGLKYYSKYTLTEKGEQVFSESAVSPKWLHMITYPYYYHTTGYEVSAADGTMSREGTFNPNDANKYAWAFVGTPYGFRILNKNSGKYMKAAAYAKDQTVKANGEANDNCTLWEAYLRYPGYSADEATLILKDSWANADYPFYYYAGGGKTVCETKKHFFNIQTELSTSYTYHIVDNSNRIAISYSEAQFPGISLEGTSGHSAIPSAIYSRYLENETLTFYAFDETYDASRLTNGNTVTTLPSNKTNIYVRYTTSALSNKPMLLGGVRGYEVKAGGEYVYETSGAFSHTSSTKNINGRNHLWYITGSDPYAVQVRNVESGNYVTANTSGPSLSLQADGTADGTRFIIMGGDQDLLSLPEGWDDQFELMVANGQDAATTANQYRISCGSDVTLAQTTGGTVAVQLQFNAAHLEVTYRIVDLHGKVAVEVKSNEEDLGLPDAFKSPLASNYRYYKLSDFNVSDDDTYTLNGSPAQMTSTAEAYDGNIYVLYTADLTTVDLNGRETGKMYRLKFADGDTFHQENSDAVRTDLRKAVYPYSNGDASFYVYGDDKWNEDINGASSTRPRWAWFVEGNDPYRVKISSYSTQTSQSGTARHAYFRTYIPEDYPHVVTGSLADNTNASDAGDLPSEYMLLGSVGAYKLVTINAVGSDNTGYESTNFRVVNSLEQYWKNNPTVKNILADAGQGSVTDEALTASQQAYMEGVDDTSHPWHTYTAWANAQPWVARTDGTTNKQYEKKKHWYQTIQMGDGTFSFEDINFYGAIILVDNHGWEVMRRMMLPDDDAGYAERQAEIRSYDSPMVEQYQFWSNVPKANGYHIYRTNESSVLQGTGTSLTEAPFIIGSNGVGTDIYVTYTVKQRYRDIYDPADGGSSESFVIRQGSKLAKTTDGSTITYTEVSTTGIPSGTTDGLSDAELQWYLKPNATIDREMGYLYSGETGAQDDAPTKAEYDAANLATGLNVFDPYNMQIESKSQSGKYFTTNDTLATLSSGVWEGNGTSVSLAALTNANTGVFTATGHDATNCHITNQTFMAVQDANGNMRLMPRFDQKKVLQEFTTLATSAAAQPYDDESGSQTTRLYQPNQFTYIVIDNQGREALRYTTISSGAPEIPHKYASPLAKDFTFYKTYTTEGGLSTLTDEITGSFAAASVSSGNIYVRYNYDADSDPDAILKGGWFTMTLNGEQVEKSDSNIVRGSTNGTWRFMQSASSDPDPYAVQFYNRSDMTAAVNSDRYIVFRHSDYTDANHSYALMQAGNASTSEYKFLDGSDATAANTAMANYATAGTTDAAKKIVLSPEYLFTEVTYNLITHTGKIVLSDTKAVGEDHKLSLPEWMQTPVMDTKAYIYYPAATLEGEAYIHKGEPTETVHTLDDDTNPVVYVYYDYPKWKKATANNPMSATATLDLSGHVPYFLANTSDASWLWYRNDAGTGIGIIQRTERDKSYDGRGFVRRHEADMVWYLTGNDPYEFRIANYYDHEGNDYGNTVKYVSVHAHETEAKDVSAVLRADGDKIDSLNTFMVLRGTRDNSSKMVVMVSGNENLSLQEYDKSIRVSYEATKYSTHYKENSNMRRLATNTETFSFYPSMAYHVITNEGKEALACAAPFHSDGANTYETIVQLPRKYQTPLIKQDEYTYHTTKPEWNAETRELTFSSDDKTIAAKTALTTPWGELIGDLYVRYSYDPEKSQQKFPNSQDLADKAGLDLNGNTWYNMAVCSGYSGTSPQYDRALYVKSGENDGGLYACKQSMDLTNLNTGTDPTYDLSHKQVLWRLEGNDPYAVKIHNAHKGLNKYLAGTSTTGHQSLTFTDDASADYNSFMYLTTSSNADTGELGATFIPTGHLADNRTFNNSSNQIWLYEWTSNNSPLYTRIGTERQGNSHICFSWISFYKAPVARKYRYHAMKYNETESEWENTWEATLEHDWLMPVVLEDNIARLYCKYEKNNVGTTDDVTGSNDFDTRTALEALNNAQFYSDASLTQRVFDEDETTHEKTYDVYPAIDTDKIYDIYFKYQPMTNAEIAATDEYKTLPFQWSTEAEIAEDVDYHTAKSKLTKDDMQAKWYFMVMDTNEEVTTGNRYFLRREDDGSVDWMNNAYTLHEDEADNYNNYSYNRLAEWYRQGDNDAFREGRWLWAFVGGDPYNAKVVNLEARVGVHPVAQQGVYSLDKQQESCVTVAKVTADGSYPVTVTENETAGDYQWSIAPGNGSQALMSLLSSKLHPANSESVDSLLYWTMIKKGTGTADPDSVALVPSANGSSQAIQLLPYVPMTYQDVNLVIKRDDHVALYNTWKSEYLGATLDEKRSQLQTYDSGISLLYFTAEERAYAAGDRIDMSSEESLPFNVRRAFCDYKLYRDDYESLGGIYIVQDGPYPDKSVQATTTGTWGTAPDDAQGQIYTPGSGDKIYDEDGRAVYPYYTIVNGHKQGAAGGAQSLYAQYTVTSDVFLKTAPTKDEVATMAKNNDHVYFMDFPGESTNVHHAFFDNEATFRIQTGDLSKKVDKNTGIWKTEKKQWNGTAFADDTADPYNRCEFRSVDNRMLSRPEHLKWYFVGDPYKVQVYNVSGDWGSNKASTNPLTVGANLARFNPVQTNFQFVVDCVHLQIPDYSNIDNRAELTPTDMYGNALDPIPNRNVGKPFYNDFYWECVPAASSEPGTFALRFKEDNDLLGYRNVYYYLAHDGLTKTYRSAEDQPEVYHINLSYNPDNEQYDKGDYIGYHKANNDNTVIQLVQPVKVYVSAFGAVEDGTETSQNVKTSNSMATELSAKRKTTEEISEYFGLGETLTEVPRHLQRKFVKYGTMNYKLTAANAYNISDCSAHTSNVFVTGTKIDPMFKFNVSYAMDDLTNNAEGKQVHLFSTCAAPNSPAASELQWLDVMIGNNNWLYYDKTNTNGSGVENQTTLVSNYCRAMSNNKTGWSQAVNGWTDGLKGLHWAFIGDPYDFTVINRRRYEDSTIDTDPMWLTGTSNLSMGNTDSTHYATRMLKTGGDSEYILTLSTDDDTDNLDRVVAKNVSSTNQFQLIDYDLTNRRVYTNNQNDLTYKNYVEYGYSYDKELTGLGTMQQRLQIRTAVAKDEDKADNDCFDADVVIRSTGGEQRISKDNMEIKYDKAEDALPYSLRRYGCTYQCYLDYVDAANPGTLVTDFDTDEFRTKVATAKAGGTRLQLTYVYTVTDETSQFFTTTADAATDDYTWMNTYFGWDQTYSGTNVEVERYRDVFDHYVYNSAGQIIDEVWFKERYTEVVPNPSESYPTTAYLNTHTGKVPVYADESTQSENDRQKWALVGDPYVFTMKNYAQYLNNSNATVNASIETTNIATEAQSFAISIDKNGKPYLTVIGTDGEADTFVTFDYDNSSTKNLITAGTGANDNDPTGNTLATDGAKPFFLASLIRYADILQYHLVIAHQHSLDHTDSLSRDDKTKLNNHLLEYLKYQEIRKDLKGASKYLNGEGTEWLPARETAIKELLNSNASLRDFISYPIDDYTVSRVGIGNHPQVPWYMKRQFCNYYIYQRDVMRSVTLDGSFDYDGDGQVGDADDIVYAYKKDANGNYLDSDGNITTNPSEYVQIFMDDAKTKPAYEIMWVSVSNQTFWDRWNSAEDGDPVTGPNKDRAYKDSEGVYLKKPKYYDDAIALNGKVLDKLQDCHYNRKVLLDVVYEVLPDQFRFADKRRNTTAWYQMTTSNAADGLMNFSYRNGIGAHTVAADHYTNDYLWAPEGDPYGFVLRSRYATINGNGWDNVAVTTKGHLPKESDHTTYNETTVLDDDAEAYQAKYTNQTQFDDKRIIHKLSGEDGATTDGPSNAVYEMFTGDASFGSSFLMHPTSAYMDHTDSDFESYYMIHDTATNKTLLTKKSGRALQTNSDANWHLQVSAQQLWPYFKFAGYVGGLDPVKAENFTNQNYYNLLKTAVEGGAQPDFSTLSKIQELVYGGTFKSQSGTTIAFDAPRPGSGKTGAREATELPMTFESENLVNMSTDYYRIQGFSQQKLSDAEGTGGIQGPRYVSGYRFKSETGGETPANAKPLRFFETSQDYSDIHTFADFATAKSFSDAVLQGNIELLPADYDASSIFRFSSADNYGRWTLATQGLNVRAAIGSTSMSTGDGTAFRLDDIGGAAVTLRTFSEEPVSGNWDTEVVNSIQTNYLTSTGDSYSLAVTANNEMNQTDGTDIQDTKWRLQPVGIHEAWPYNEMPLRVEVNKGGVKNCRLTDPELSDASNKDKNYYGSMYVPFDTRLGNTTDVAFTLTGTPTDGTLSDPGSVTMASVSQLNDMGNPQFVPAEWPVVIRTSNSNNKITLKNKPVGDAAPTTYAERHWVNLYIPNVEPTRIPAAESSIKLSGQYLEQTLSDGTDKTIMVFGLPFSPTEGHTTHDYDQTKQVGFFTNDNWMRESKSQYKAHSGSYPNTATVATHSERDNKYVYHNKIYYVYDKAYSAPSSAPIRYSIALFDTLDNDEGDPSIDVFDENVPWPCDVYDLSGRKVASNETPSTLRLNHPGLAKGVYIFGGRKMIIK